MNHRKWNYFGQILTTTLVLVGWNLENIAKVNVNQNAGENKSWNLLNTKVSPSFEVLKTVLFFMIAFVDQKLYQF